MANVAPGRAARFFALASFFCALFLDALVFLVLLRPLLLFLPLFLDFLPLFLLLLPPFLDFLLLLLFLAICDAGGREREAPMRVGDRDEEDDGEREDEEEEDDKRRKCMRSETGTNKGMQLQRMTVRLMCPVNSFRS